jgi:hypothetical protein
VQRPFYELNSYRLIHTAYDYRCQAIFDVLHAAIREFEEYLRVAPNAPDAQKISQLIAELKKSA